MYLLFFSAIHFFSREYVLFNFLSRLFMLPDVPKIPYFFARNGIWSKQHYINAINIFTLLSINRIDTKP